METQLENIPEEVAVKEDVQIDAQDTETPNYHAMTCAELLAELQRIVDSADMQAHREVSALKTAFYARRNKEQLEELSAFVEEGNDPGQFAAIVSPEEVPFKDLLAKFKTARGAFLEAEEKRMQENLEKKQAVIAELKQIVEDIDNVNVNFYKFQQLQQEFREKADLPPQAETETWKTYQQLVEEFYDKLKINKELRDLDFKKNLEAKRALIEEAKKLTEKDNIIEAARQLQALHNQWREIGPVGKDLRVEIWDEFKALSTAVNRRHQEFFEARKASEQEAEAAKTALCEEAEAILANLPASYNGWDEETKKVIGLQTRWKEAGYASRKNNTVLFNRFRAACDSFFKAKSEFYTNAREAQNENYTKKVALCERAEALANEENMKRAAEEAVALQAEWKEIGNSGRRQSEEIWRRFSTACNDVFTRRQKFIGERRHEENENLKAKRALIERVNGLDREGDPKANLEVVRECQAEWQKIGHVPVKVKESLWKEFRELCDVFYEADRGRKREVRDSRFRHHVRELRAEGGNKIGSERDRLMRDLERKRNELKTYENNLGFFNVKSSTGNSMLKEMERRTESIKKDIADIEAKIKLLAD